MYRSPSSRQRKSSRSVGTTSTTQKARRASVATDTPMPPTSPRGPCVVPNIALDPGNISLDERANHRIHSSRNSLAPESLRSPRNSLTPSDAGKSPRNSITSDMLYGSRHSLVPGSCGGTLTHDMCHNRSPRHSVVSVGGCRTPLLPENGSVIHCGHPLAVVDSYRSPRGSVANLEFRDRSPRGSSCPDMPGSGRNSITPVDIDKSPRGSIGSDHMNQSPRGSITPDCNRSPRGSIAPDPNRSQRGSISRDRTSCTSITYDGKRSPRGSRGSVHNIKGNLMVQEHRRGSADQVCAESPRNPSPYRQSNSGSIRTVRTAEINPMYQNANVFTDSRRASIAVSQASGDESRRLFTDSYKVPEKCLETTNTGVVTYGSVVFQLKDAHVEANSTCEFVCRALRVVSKTWTCTIFLFFFLVMAILMFFFGQEYWDQCPVRPEIPYYLVYGGVVSSIYISLQIYSQIQSRRVHMLSVPPTQPNISPMKLISNTLLLFLMVWFALGNYWVLKIWWPEHEKIPWNPNQYCGEVLYIFCLIHLAIVHVFFIVLTILALSLGLFRILEFPFPGSYA